MLQTRIIATLITIQISITFAVITPDPECGTTKGCYPTTCPLEGCQDFHLSWEDAEDYIRFKMVFAVPAIELVWTAIGFSKDSSMKDTSVVMCKSDTMTAEIGHTDRSRYFYAPLRTRSSLKDVSVSRTELYMTCIFSRIKIPTEYPPLIFALNRPDLYLFHALGPVTGGFPNRHEDRQASSSPVSFLIIDERTTTTTTSTTTATASPTTTHSPRTYTRTSTNTTTYPPTNISTRTHVNTPINTSTKTPTYTPTNSATNTPIDTTSVASASTQDNAPTTPPITIRSLPPTAEPASTAMSITVSSMILTCLSVIAVLMLK